MSAARYTEEHGHAHEHYRENPDDAVEGLIADIMVAILSLEYGTVTISVKNGQVMQIERNEKRRLAKSSPHTVQPKTHAS